MPGHAPKHAGSGGAPDDHTPDGSSRALEQRTVRDAAGFAPRRNGAHSRQAHVEHRPASVLVRLRAPHGQTPGAVRRRQRGSGFHRPAPQRADLPAPSRFAFRRFERGLTAQAPERSPAGEGGAHQAVGGEVRETGGARRQVAAYPMERLGGPMRHRVFVQRPVDLVRRNLEGLTTRKVRGAERRLSGSNSVPPGRGGGSAGSGMRAVCLYPETFSLSGSTTVRNGNRSKSRSLVQMRLIPCSRIRMAVWRS